MSVSLLIKWFEKLLFGHAQYVNEPVPIELTQIVTRLRIDGIRLQDTIPHGGLVQFHYTVQGDLYRFLEHFKHQRDENNPPVFKNKMVEQFYKHLMIHLARRLSEHDTTLLPLPPPDDQLALESIRSGEAGPIQYHSASYWGDFTRRLLNHRRPIEKQLSKTRTPSHDFGTRLNWLYEFACQSRGEVFDPLTTVMVPYSEHVDAVHWQSDALLEKFVRAYPDHLLARAIRGLVRKNVRQLLNGRRPSCLRPEDAPDVDIFLVNVSVVHDSIHDVPTDADHPPKTVDVFQRLLALAERDHLWQNIPPTTDDTSISTDDTLQLTERFHLIERQNSILLKYIGS